MGRLDFLRGRLTCSVEELATVLGVSRSTAYEMVARRQVRAIPGTGRKVVLVIPLLRYLGAEDLIPHWMDPA